MSYLYIHYRMKNCLVLVSLLMFWYELRSFKNTIRRPLHCGEFDLECVFFIPHKVEDFVDQSGKICLIREELPVAR